MLDVVITAGGRPKENEPLFPATRGNYKALLVIQGKPMIQWILDAVSGSRLVDRVCVVGLPPTTALSCAKRLELIPDTGSMLGNIQSAVVHLYGNQPDDRKFLVIASDIPAVTSQMVDWMAEAVAESDHDFYYNVIRREVMEKRYPGSRRSYVKFNDVQVCGGDLNALSVSAIMNEKAVYRQLVDSRKNALKQAAIIGFDTLFSLLIHRLSLAEAVTIVSKRLDIRGRAIVCPYAEIGMDVDKPGQLEIIRADLSRS